MQSLYENLNKIEAKLKETGQGVEKVKAERKAAASKVTIATLEFDDARDLEATSLEDLVQSEKALSKAARALSRAKTSHETAKTARKTAAQAHKTAGQAVVYKKAQIGRLQEDCNLRAAETKIEAEHDEIERELHEVAKQVEELKKNYYEIWESWSASELVQRFESGDMVYTPFIEANSNYVEKVLDAYKSITAHGDPSEAEILAISRQIVQSQYTSPWGCRFWSSETAAFLNPFEKVSDIKLREDLTVHTLGEDVVPEIIVWEEASSNGSIMAKSSGEDSKPEVPVKEDETISYAAEVLLPDLAKTEEFVKQGGVSSVLGKRPYESVILPPSSSESVSILTEDYVDTLNYPLASTPITYALDINEGDGIVIMEETEDKDGHLAKKARMDSREVDSIFFVSEEFDLTVADPADNVDWNLGERSAELDIKEENLGV